MVGALALAGCGDDAPDPSATVTPATSAPTTAATSAAPAGTVDPMAITAFTCRRNAKGAWVAKGTLENTGAKDRDYRVAAFVGRQEGPARTVELERVKAGDSVPFTLRPIAAAPDGPCHLQALVLD